MGQGFKSSMDKESSRSSASRWGCHGGGRGKGAGESAGRAGMHAWELAAEEEGWVRVPGTEPRVQMRAAAPSREFSLKDTWSIP